MTKQCRIFLSVLLSEIHLIAVSFKSDNVYIKRGFELLVNDTTALIYALQSNPNRDDFVLLDNHLAFIRDCLINGAKRGWMSRGMSNVQEILEKEMYLSSIPEEEGVLDEELSDC